MKELHEMGAILTYFQEFLALAPCCIQFFKSKYPHMQMFIILAQKLSPKFKNRFYQIWNLTKRNMHLNIQKGYGEEPDWKDTR